MRAIHPPCRRAFAVFLLVVSVGGLAVQSLRSQTPDGFNTNETYIGYVFGMAVQTDGKILVGGPNYPIKRFNPNGSLDLGYSVAVGNQPDGSPYVRSLLIQPDGKTLVGGRFTELNGLSRSRIGRVNPDGDIDVYFYPSANNLVESLALQTDGKILAGGLFTTMAGQPRTNLARLNSDGTLDPSFNPGIGFGSLNSSVYSLAIQNDGKILVAGLFTSLGGQSRNYIGRVNPTGTLDDTFDPGANDSVLVVAVQADGKILAGGNFTNLAGMPRSYLGRLNADGSLDTNFITAANGPVWSFAIQANGKIVVGGGFTSLGGQMRNNIGRLNSDGTLDIGFESDANNYCGVALQDDGKILVSGAFSMLGGQQRIFLGRLNNTEPASQSLGYVGSTIAWMRGGSSPEVWRVGFDHFTNGVWNYLGDGARISGGWQLTNVTLPPSSTLRARGYFAGAQGGASGWVIETATGPLVFVSQPTNQSVSFGATTTFSALVGGPGPITYQWYKNGIQLVDSSGISGALTFALTLTNAAKSNEGDYRVVASNFSGSITSEVATLTVVDPVITGQGIGGNLDVGRNVTFSVTAKGTGLSYQWSKDGIPLPHETNSSLVFTNLQFSDAGGYRAVVTGTYGSVTSVLGTLIVNGARLDTNFNATVNGWVSPVVVQTDGKIIFGGGFTTVGGTSRGRVARVSTNGVLDTTFLNPNANDDVYSLALQPDGKLLVGGEFTSLGSQTKYAIGRLNTNGALDTTFTATVFNPFPYPQSTPSYRVQAMLLQPDGKIIVGGRSTTTLFNGQTVIGGFLYRLSTNGTSDNTFSTGGLSGGPIISLAQQPDGKILLGGYFSSVGGQTRNRIARINTNGALDTVFNPGLAAPSGINPSPLAMTVQPDGKIIVGGAFNTIAGQAQTNLSRLNEDGTLDGTFRPFPSGAANPDVWSVALQTDGQILVSGYFLTMNGAPRSRLARLNVDGTLDATFNPGANAAVNGLALQSDGRILATGFFSQLGGVSRSYIGRLHNTAIASHVLSYNANNLDWQRGGASPEVWRTTFESSTNGNNWIMLGAGTRNPSGWQLSGATLPPGGTIRSRGYTAGGGYDAASWFVEERLLIAPNIFANSGSFGFQSNRFSFNLNAPPGAAVIVEASTNLVHWSPVLTNLMGSVGDFLFQDLQSGLHPRRYYRAKFYFGSLPKPSFRSSTAGFQSGQFSFNLDGIAGQAVVIEASTNLVNWSPLTTNTMGIEPFLFSDTNSSNSPVRFYRAKLQ